MFLPVKKTWVLLFLLVPVFLRAQPVKIITNHVGYEDSRAKHAVIVADNKYDIKSFSLVDAVTGKTVFTGSLVYSGKVDKWKNFQFWTIDFSTFTTPGSYKLQAGVQGKTVSSYPFAIGKNVLEKATISDVVYYFKGQRSSGLFDKADHHLALSGTTADTIDAHGGWYDATGDY